MDFPNGEHLRWRTPTVGTGDEVLIQMVESEAIDEPTQRLGRSKTHDRALASKTTVGRSKQTSPTNTNKSKKSKSATQKKKNGPKK
jgi:hypothetical protein